MSSTVSQPNRLEPQRHDRISPPQAAVDQPPRVRRITVAVAALLAAVSATGLVWGSGLYGSSAPSTLVSQGGDAANLVVVVPALLVASLFAQRGSMTGQLLRPGALFYVMYVSAIYLLAAPLSVVSFGHALLVVASAAALIGDMANLDTVRARRYLAGAPTRVVAGALVAIGLAAYAGLIGNALPELGEATTDVAFRSQWAVDMALGTPVLIVGGVLLWRRAPWGYATAAALLLVSTLGGAAFAAAAVFEQLLGDQPLDTAVVAVHSTISAIALLLLVVLLRGADRANSSAAGSDG